MGIQVTQANSYPAVTYDKVHMTSLSIEQGVFTDDSAQPIYYVRVAFKLYGVVNGIRYYANEDKRVIELPDFLTLAMTKAAGGDTDLVLALQAIEVAVAKIIEDQATLGTVTVI